jgi:hypothetical protein
VDLTFFSHLDRPQAAIPHTKAMIDEECSRGDNSWLQNPYALSTFGVCMFTMFRTVFALHGQTLVLTRTNDNEAVKMLRRAMLGIESANSPTGLPQLIRTWVFLSRALRNIGVDDEAKSLCVKIVYSLLFDS